MKRSGMLSQNLVFLSLQCVVLPQHGLSDEVTSEEEEEEEMGEVFVHSLHRCRCLILFVSIIHPLAAGHRPGPRPGPL